MAFIEFPKALYKNGFEAAVANDLEEQEALLEDGYELLPTDEEPAPPCGACAKRDEEIADLKAQLAALLNKRGKKIAVPEVAAE